MSGLEVKAADVMEEEVKAEEVMMEFVEIDDDVI